MKNKLKKILIFLFSFILFLLILYPVLKMAIYRITANNYTLGGKIYGITVIVLFIFLVYIFYRYILKIFQNFIDKKWKKFIFMILPIVILTILAILVKTFMVYNFKIICADITYILLTILLPLIVLGLAILDEEKNKIKYIIKILIFLTLTIVIYYFNFLEMNYLSKSIIEKFTNNSLEEIVKTNREAEEEKIENLVKNYLNPYVQKMDKNSYLERYDINYIISGIIKFADIDIKIVYSDDGNNVNLELSNTDENWEKYLEENLEGNYYKFKYEIENLKVKVYFEKYQTEYNSNNEKNENIKITGNLNSNIIENLSKIYKDENAENYTFYNKIVVERNIENKELEKFKILLVYDNQTNNFVPYTDDVKQYEKIKSYKVYSTGISITLEDDIKIKNEYYTIRLNRYNDKYEIDKNNYLYFYKFEPVVTKLTDWNNNTVLEMKFDNTYILKQLKNIEILFGYK